MRQKTKKYVNTKVNPAQYRAKREERKRDLRLRRKA